MNTRTILTFACAGLFAVAAISAPVGVTVNGIALDDAGLTNAGWAYAVPTLTLSGAGPFTISGANTAGNVQVVIPSGVANEVTLSNLTLVATGDDQCPFALRQNANVTLRLAGTNTLISGSGRPGIEVAAGRTLSITNAPGDDAAFLSVQGDYLGAGIGSGSSGNGGTITISGGTVEATGGSWAAGIGGGGYGDGGTVTINGGVVIATGGYNGAGIGGGDDNDGGTVIINGGVVAATGVDGGAGIGGGSKGNGGKVNISGGTVFAQGSEDGADMGPGGGAVADANTFTGGSIRLAHGDASLQPSNGTDPVGCAKVSGFAPGAQVEFTDPGNLPGYYGTTGIFADEGGAIYLWLPDGEYHFTANGLDCTAKIKDGTGPSGVTVNGEEAAFGPDDPASAGWSFNAATRTVSLFGNGSFTLSGVNELGGVCFAVPDNIANTVVLSNLTLRTTIADQCAFALGQNANVTLRLAGTNTLISGSGRPGIEVAAGRTLSITNAPGDDAAMLTVTGGDYGAGIGGDYGVNGGTVTIHGGTVVATGGDRSAGIGGGRGGNGGTVTIHGGTVTATGGRWGAGIGGGDYGHGGTVTIHGGTVFALGDSYCAGIGGGDSGGGGTVTINGGAVTATSDGFGAGIGGGDEGDSGTVTINGGTVFAQGGTDGADIGPGRNGAVVGANTFAGGSICLSGSFVTPAPSNNAAPVFCAVVAGFAPGARVEFTGPGNLPAGFGTTDIFADEGGAIYLWLPNGVYTFTANGHDYTVTIQDGVGPTGVTVNGVEVALGPPNYAAGWTYDATTGILSLTNAGPFTLSGANALGRVQVVVTNDVASTVTLSNLTLRAVGDQQCAFALETNAVVSLHLAGTNTLISGSGRPGIEVAAGRTLSIAPAPGNATGALTATGGDVGAGIGGGYAGGGEGAGGTVNISGGTVVATGGYGGAGIGGGYASDGGEVNISGGTVFAQGVAGGSDIGPGEGSTVSGSNIFTGGSIRLANDIIAPAPSNITERVWCVTVPGLTPYAAVVVTELDPYGVNDLFADAAGKLYLWLPNGNYEFTVSETEYEATVADADTAAIQKSPPASNAYLTLYSTNAFTITPQINSWDGTLECSTDTTNWVVFTTNGADAAAAMPGDYRLYLRGTANNRISANDVNAPGWTITADSQVACYGNIATLLDYATATNGGHPAMDAWCFANLFNGCTALRRAPALPGTTLTNHCYRGMFSGCTGLAKTPALPATNLADSCYMNMFRGCTSLANASALPAATLAYACYSGMFLGCTGLTQAPSLSATNLDTACYMNMFKGCTSLTDAPALPAATLAHSCYSSMFSDCVSLTAPPALSATTLAHSCYSKMFSGCLGLTNLPALPAKNLADYCYSQMFNGCIGIKLNAVGPGPEWGIPAGAISASQWNVNMLFGTGGTFTNDPVIGVTYYLPLVTPVAPSGVSASDGTFTNKIRITWNATSLATGYRVWRHTANNSAAATEIGSTAGTIYDDVATVAKTTYYYW
ncbi:MAG: hypothetical protein ACOYCD_05680, partial [Kiritimatiellia bacterium]